MPGESRQRFSIIRVNVGLRRRHRPPLHLIVRGAPGKAESELMHEGCEFYKLE